MLKTINIAPLDSAYSETKYLVSLGERYFVVSEALAKFLGILKQSQTFEEAASAWSVLKGEAYTADDVRTIYETYVLNVLNTEPPKNGSFLWSKDILSKDQVDVLQNVFKVLFRPAIIVTVLLLSVALETVFFMQGNKVSIGEIDLLTIIILVITLLLSSLFHEIGHASACCYFGEKAKSIGLGLYLNFPVFYTDVSDIWKLSRRKRMVVNFAGTYFQLIFLIPCIAVYLLTGNQIVKYLIYTINLNFIFILNPFFRFDGYWIMSDLIGIPNLRGKSNWIVQALKNKILRKPDCNGFWRQIRIKEQVLLIIYTISTNLFFAYYLFFVIPNLLKSCYFELPGQVKRLVVDIAVGNSITFSLISSVAAKLFILLLTFYFFYKLIRCIFSHV